MFKGMLLSKSIMQSNKSSLKNYFKKYTKNVEKYDGIKMSESLGQNPCNHPRCLQVATLA